MKKRTLVAGLSLFLAILGAASPRSLHAEASGDCQIWKDAQGLSHAWASHRLALYGCFGFLHGRDRAGQMDHLRRLARGKTAELYGWKAIRQDFQMRLFDFPARAQVIWSELPSRSRDLLGAYARGVNRGFAAAKESVSEPWTGVDSLSVLLLQSFDQTRGTFEDDLKEDYAGAPKVTSVNTPWHTTVLKAGEYPKRVGAALQSGERLADDVAWGSNQWVLAPGRARSGFAWVANDPHLKLTDPPMWYPLALGSDDGIAVAGVSLPGIPMIPSGANRNVSWGLTNAYIDVADVAVAAKGELLISHRPFIFFKFGWFKIPFFFKTFQTTKENWPVLPIEHASHKNLVLRWSGFDLKGSELDGVFDLIEVKSSRELDQKLAALGVTGWNFAFADIRGEIGFRVIGKVPKREQDPATGFLSRTTDDLRAWRYLSASEIPHLFAPKRGFIVTANHAHWPQDSKYSGGRAYANGTRAFRIEELFAQHPKVDLSILQSIQCDVQAVDARFMVPLILKVWDPTTADGMKFKKKLGLWDFNADVKCEVCVTFRKWMEELKTELKLNDSGLYLYLRTSASPDELDRVFISAYTSVGPIPKRWGMAHGARFEAFSGYLEQEIYSVATPGDRNSVNVATGPWDELRKEFIHRDGASVRFLTEMKSPPQIWWNFPDPKDPLRWSRCEYQPMNAWQTPKDLAAGAVTRIAL